MHDPVPRLCGLRRCSREQCVLKFLLRDFLHQGRQGCWLIKGHVSWMGQPLLCCQWAFPSSFIPGSLEKSMLHLRPVAALLMSEYRDNAGSLYLHFPCNCDAHVSYLALLSCCRSSMLKSCVSALNFEALCKSGQMSPMCRLAWLDGLKKWSRTLKRSDFVTQPVFQKEGEFMWIPGNCFTLFSFRNIHRRHFLPIKALIHG